MKRSGGTKLLLATGFVLVGAAIAVQADPPPWAPAYGYRAKQQYRYVYYPQQGVYYSPESRAWFWAGGSGWQVGASLPVQYQGGINVSASVGSP